LSSPQFPKNNQLSNYKLLISKNRISQGQGFKFQEFHFLGLKIDFSKINFILEPVLLKSMQKILYTPNEMESTKLFFGGPLYQII